MNPSVFIIIITHHVPDGPVRIDAMQELHPAVLHEEDTDGAALRCRQLKRFV